MFIRVREMQPDEADLVGEITLAAYDAFGRWEPDAPYRQILRDTKARVDAGAVVLVAVDVPDEGPEIVVGAVTLTIAPSQFFEYLQGVEGDGGFRMLAVRPEAQGNGAGRAMVAAALSHLAVKGVRRAVITSMEWMDGAHKLYEGIGFVRRADLDVAYGAGVGHAFHLDLRADAAEHFPAPGPVPAQVKRWARREIELAAAREAAASSGATAHGCD